MKTVFILKDEDINCEFMQINPFEFRLDKTRALSSYK